MANCCPRTCSRLAAAAVFISIGIVQFIAGLILLRSRYVSLLSGPNFWTAALNICVGGLLGISSAIWKSTNKKTLKHVSRRNVLAALVFSALVLNATTAAILIMGEMNILLSIQLESNNSLLATEIIGYAYAASVCSPIVAVVTSSAYMLGLCFQARSHKSKKVTLQTVAHDDTPDVYSWVYTAKLPKPDLDVMRMTAPSSSSGTTSSESDSDSCVEVPVQLRAHTPAYASDRCPSDRDKVSYRRETHHEPMERRISQNSLRPKCSKSNKVSFADESTSDKCSSLSAPISQDNLHNYSDSGRHVGPFSISESYKAHKDRLSKSRTRVRPKILFKEHPSSEEFRYSGQELIYEVPFRNPDALGKQDILSKRKPDSNSFLNVHNSSNFRITRKEPKEFPSLHQEALQTSDVYDDFQRYHHRTLLRTSTADDSKCAEKISSPEDSEIYFDSVFLTKDARNNQSQMKNSTFGKNFRGSHSTCEVNASSLPGKVTPLNPSDFRAKLVPVPTPVVSNVLWNSKEPHRYSRSITKDSHSKSTDINDRHDYQQSNFSSFRNEINKKLGVPLNELDRTRYNRRHSSAMVSPMDSISEVPTEETNEQFVTSAHTSGYVSTLDESDDYSCDLSARRNSQRLSSPTKRASLFNEIGHEEYSESPSLTASHDDSVQRAIDDFSSANPDITVEDLVSRLLQTTV